MVDSRSLAEMTRSEPVKSDEDIKKAIVAMPADQMVRFIGYFQRWLVTPDSIKSAPEFSYKEIEPLGVIDHEREFDALCEQFFRRMKSRSEWAR